MTQNDIERLKKYDELEKEGRLIVLPVPLGSYVWIIVTRSNNYDGREYLALTQEEFSLGMLKMIGKTVFLTYEDANEALSKRRKGN